MSEFTEKIQQEKVCDATLQTSFWQDFLSLVKIGIVNSNMLTTFTGLWLAIYFNGLDFLEYIDSMIFTILGSSFIIAGSCVVNNHFDRDIDHLMERTKIRPTVTGKFKENNVLAIAIGLLITGFLMLSFTSLVAVFMGVIGTVTYVFFYTMWSKRRYTLNTVIGSISGAVPPLIGWGAIDDNLHPVAWVLFFIMFFWQIPHFLALAIKRVEEYRNAGIPMLPVVYGFEITKRQILIWIICLFPLPFFLYGLGIWLVVIGTLLNGIWLYLGFRGYRHQDINKWSTKMFIFSLNYLTIFFVAMIGFTFV